MFAIVKFVEKVIKLWFDLHTDVNLVLCDKDLRLLPIEGWDY